MDPMVFKPQSQHNDLVPSGPSSASGELAGGETQAQIGQILQKLERLDYKIEDIHKKVEELVNELRFRHQ